MQAQRKGLEDAERRQPSASQDRRLQEKIPCCLLDLGLSASRTVRKYISVVQSISLWYFVMVAYHIK